LNKKIAQKLFTIWEVPHIDLLASLINHQTQIYCSWNPDYLAYAIDTLTILWNNMFAYAYSPICLIPKILQHMTQYNCQLILIAPHWPRRHWFPNLLKLIADFLRKLPVREDLLDQLKSNILHPNPAVFNLAAWLLSINTLKRKVFLSKLENYSCKFRKSNSWGSRREVDPYNASLTDAAECLTELFSEGLQYRTIPGYGSMLSSVMSPIEKKLWDNILISLA
jgi:hypothetical protein